MNNNASKQRNFKFTIDSYRNSYSTFNTWSSKTESYPLNIPKIQSNNILIENQANNEHQYQIYQTSSIRPYKQRTITSNKSYISTINPTVTPSPYKFSFLEPQNITITPIKFNQPSTRKLKSRNRSKTCSPIKAYRKYETRQAIKHDKSDARPYSRSMDEYKTESPPNHTLQKIQIMRWNSPPPHLQIKMNHQSKKEKLPIPSKLVQIEFIHVYSNGIRYFCRDLSSSMS
eukprot:90127_1